MKQSLFIASLAGIGGAISSMASYPPPDPSPENSAEPLGDILSFESAITDITQADGNDHLFGEQTTPPSTTSKKRTDGDCHDLPEGAAPLPTLDTWESFLDYPGYSSFAEHAETPTTYEQAFEDLSASVSSPSYMGVYTLGAYNPQLCAGYCDVLNACVAFNIYISRDPSKQIGPDCPNPPATANIKCTLFSSPISPHEATNEGQTQAPPDAYGQSFEVKVRSSNGYNKQASETGDEVTVISGPPPNPVNSTAVGGFEGPYALPAAIRTSGQRDDWIGTRFIQHRYNPSLCARLCDSITKTRRTAVQKACRKHRHAKACEWQPCNYFNSYELVNEQNNQAGFYCTLFSKEIGSHHASVSEVNYSTGKTYYVANSWGYMRNPQESNQMRGPAYAYKPSETITQWPQTTEAYIPAPDNQVPATSENSSTTTIWVLPSSTEASAMSRPTTIVVEPNEASKPAPDYQAPATSQESTLDSLRSTTTLLVSHSTVTVSSHSTTETALAQEVSKYLVGDVSTTTNLIPVSPTTTTEHVLHTTTVTDTQILPPVTITSAVTIVEWLTTTRWQNRLVTVTTTSTAFAYQEPLTTTITVQRLVPVPTTTTETETQTETHTQVVHRLPGSTVTKITGTVIEQHHLVHTTSTLELVSTSTSTQLVQLEHSQIPETTLEDHVDLPSTTMETTSELPTTPSIHTQVMEVRLTTLTLMGGTTTTSTLLPTSSFETSITSTKTKNVLIPWTTPTPTPPPPPSPSRFKILKSTRYTIRSKVPPHGNRDHDLHQR